MASKTHDLVKALNKAGKPATVERGAVREERQTAETSGGSYQAPSREGRIHIGAWLDSDYKTSLLACRVKDHSLTMQDLLEEALNDLFAKYDVPVVSSAKPRTPSRQSRARPQAANRRPA